MENPNYYSIIIAEVRYDKRLRPNAKLLYSEITALTNQKGYCYASNRYFAELYGVSKVTISNWISQLVKYGYITSQLEYKEGTKEIINRYIRLTKEGVKENIKTPIKEMVKVNTKQINNKININKYTDICSFYNEIEFKNIWKEFEKVRAKKKASTSERAYVKLLNKLMEYSNGDLKTAIEIVEKSADSGWSDLYQLKTVVNNKSTKNGSRLEQFLSS